MDEEFEIEKGKKNWDNDQNENWEISEIIQFTHFSHNCIKFFSRFFSSKCPFVHELFFSGYLDFYLSLISHPLSIYAKILAEEDPDKNYMIAPLNKVITSSLKPIVYEAKENGIDVITNLIDKVTNEIKELEKILEKPLDSLNDFSNILINPTNLFFENKEKNPYISLKIFNLLNSLYKIEISVDFIRVNHTNPTPESYNSAIIQLINIYTILIGETSRMNQVIVKKILISSPNELQKEMKKEEPPTEEEINEFILKSIENNNNTGVVCGIIQATKKFLIQNLNNCISHEKPNKFEEPINYLSGALLKMLTNINLKRITIEENEAKEEILFEFLNDLNIIKNFNDLLISSSSIIKSARKIAGGTHPHFLISLYENYGFEIIFSYLKKYLQNFTNVFKTNNKNFQTIYEDLGKSLCQTLNHLILLPTDIGLNTKIKETVEKGSKIKEYLNSIILYQTKHFINCAKLIPNFSEDLRANVVIKQISELCLEKLKSSLNIKHFESNPSKNLKDNLYMFGRNPYINDEDDEDISPFANNEEFRRISEQVIQTLTDMGFTRERAEIALSNIEFPDTNSAAEWLFMHPEEIIEKPAEIKLSPSKEKMNIPLQENHLIKTLKNFIDLDERPESLEPLKEEEFKKQMFNILQKYGQYLLYEIYTFDGFEKQISDFLLMIIDNQLDPNLKKENCQDLAFALLTAIQDWINIMIPGFGMKLGFKGKNAEQIK